MTVVKKEEKIDALLDRRTIVIGTRWVALARWLPLLITWPITIALARILSPEDYGYLALVTVFTRFGRIVAEGGLSNTVVLGPELERGEYETLHSLALTTFLAVGTVLCLAAWPLELVYRREGMGVVILALSFGFVLEGLSLVPTALMRRQLRFKETAIAEITRVVVEAAVSLTLALWGWRYWSLVVGYLCGASAGTITIGVRARLSLGRLRKSVIGKIRASANKLLAASTTNFLAQSSDASVGGLVVSVAQLGGYTYMAGLARSPIEKLSGIITYASASVFGSVRSSSDHVVNALLRITSVSALAMFPILGGIAVVAGDLVPVALGPKWDEYILVLQILCIQSAILPLTSALDNAMIATNGERTYALNGVLLLLLLPLAFLVLGHFYGANGLALAWLVPQPILIARRLQRLRHSIALPVRSWLGALSGPLVATIIMLAVVSIARNYGPIAQANSFARLLLSAGLGAALYLLLVLWLCKDQLDWLARIPGTGAIGKLCEFGLQLRARFVAKM